MNMSSPINGKNGLMNMYNDKFSIVQGEIELLSRSIGHEDAVSTYIAHGNMPSGGVTHSLEGVGTFLKKLWDKVVKFFKDIGKWVKKLFVKNVRDAVTKTTNDKTDKAIKEFDEDEKTLKKDLKNIEDYTEERKKEILLEGKRVSKIAALRNTMGKVDIMVNVPVLARSDDAPDDGVELHLSNVNVADRVKVNVSEYVDRVNRDIASLSTVKDSVKTLNSLLDSGVEATSDAIDLVNNISNFKQVPVFRNTSVMFTMLDLEDTNLMTKLIAYAGVVKKYISEIEGVGNKYTSICGPIQEGLIKYCSKVNDKNMLTASKKISESMSKISTTLVLFGKVVTELDKAIAEGNKYREVFLK